MYIYDYKLILLDFQVLIVAFLAGFTFFTDSEDFLVFLVFVLLLVCLTFSVLACFTVSCFVLVV